MADDLVLTTAPDAGATLNPFVLVDDAAGLIGFVTAVFDVPETTWARTPMPDGSLIHAEVRFGAVNLMLADRQDGWPLRPGFLQVWVRDAGEVLRRAVDRGAEVITEPTPFYGETTLARMVDPWRNVWWLYQPSPGQADPEWGGSVFTTLDQGLRAL